MIPREWVESLIIFIVIIINAILGIIQENKAEKSLEALKKMSSPMCKVLRDGKVIPIETIHLVVGDIIMVEAGDFIPADARIIECSHLRVDESALTGESVTVEKISDVIDGIEDKEIALGNRKNMLFSSTFVTNGKAKAVVTEVGMKTEIGKIAGMLIGDDNQTTPLQQKLSQVGKVIGIMSIIICVVVFFLEMLTTKGTSDTYLLDAFKTAIALAVAAIPEGLATVVTIILAIGVGNMAKKNAIVKKLPAVETLDSTSIICCDKTGTLTQNKMTVQELYHHTNKKLENLTEDDKELITYFALCCDAQITNVDGVEKRIGDPTETALIEFNNLYGRPIDKIERVADLPFDSIRKMMTVVVKVNNHYLSITKGAPDIILHHALLSDKEKQEILNANTNMASRALRVLGLGIKAHANKPECNENLEENLTFLGLVGMIDPARPEVKEAIEVASKAGIRTIMITGDHITTASAIAKELNILKDGYRAISSEELQKMSDEELGNQIEDYAVYARVSPEDKVRIVEMWQKKGKVVSMTGDGVNDSPALKKADIGCAMGITGTDVSKEAADMILADDNFTTIVEAVKEGRGIYNNVKNV
ncbi:MAG: HAD-IC family P-type ATPase [Bacilli bacterium]